MRHLMDAGGLAALVAPSCFQSISNLTGPEHAGAATWTTAGVMQPGLQSDASQTNQANRHDWIVQFDTASLVGISSVAETTSLLVGGGVDFSVIRGLGLAGQVLVRSSGASLDVVANWLACDVHVASFEQDAVGQLETTPNDPQLGNLWGMTKIHAQDAWSIATGSRSVVVGVIDTGVDYTHPDLAANIWTNPGEIPGNGIDDDHNGFVDDVHGYDFYNNDGNPMDDNSHGTHVSGTIAAVGNNAQGVAGINWSTSIMALKFIGSDGSGWLSDAVRAINYATMMRTSYGVNIRVTNNSWGGGGFSQSMQDAIQANNDAGILFVAAAGNSSSDNDTSPQYPSNYAPKNVLAVAASDSSDRLASFSNYGATTVDIAAPGVSVYSTIPGNSYAYYSGTSMATPHVAGVAALAWSLEPNASVAQIRSAILQGADPVAAFSGKMVTGGRLNAYNTLRLLPSLIQDPPTFTDFNSDFNGDFNGDGTSDVLRQNQTDETVGAWIIKSAAVNGWAGFGQADPTVWKTVGTGDFNGDSTSDVLWQNKSTGLVGAWIIKNGGINGWAGFGQADPNMWKIIGMGDFNGDKTADILWQNQSTGLVGAWIIKNGAVNGWAGFGQADPNVWKIISMGDFNSDKTADILWQNQSTGLVGAWIIKSGAVNGWAGFGQADPNVWKIVGTGDYNADSTSDILWQNRSTGLVGVWIIKNAAVNGWVAFGQADPTVWKITGTGDYNGDKTSDVLWQNQSTGLIGAWIIKNGAINSWAGFGQADSTVWKIAGAGQASSSALHAANAVNVPASNVASLVQSELQSIVHEAITCWARTGLNLSSIARLTQVEFAIADLNGSLLGKVSENRVTIDINAAGHGWFIDSTPRDEAEYSLASNTRLKAIDPQAVDRIDLLSVVEHELGHVLGLADLNALADNVMSCVMESGVRKTPYKRHVDAAFAAV